MSYMFNGFISRFFLFKLHIAIPLGVVMPINGYLSCDYGTKGCKCIVKIFMSPVGIREAFYVYLIASVNLLLFGCR